MFATVFRRKTLTSKLGALDLHTRCAVYSERGRVLSVEALFRIRLMA